MLARSQLRLSYLDFGPVQTSLPSGVPFYADVPILNDALTHHSSLLLTRLAPNGGLYIIENAGDGVFVACRLRSWVDEGTFERSATGCIDNSLMENLCVYGDQPVAHARSTPSSGLVGLPMTVVPSPKRPKNRKGVLARMSILPRTEHREQPVLQTEQEADIERVVAAAECQTGEISSVGMPGSPYLAKHVLKSDAGQVHDKPTEAQEVESGGPVLDSSRSADDPFATHRDILLKTLYTSQTALAYFTKSTLPRTRAAFRSSTMTGISELADFYRGRLIPSKKMDLKYRDAIPRIVRKTILQGSPDKMGPNPLATDSQKRRIRRKRLGKDGLYADEEDFVRTWWLNRDRGKMELSSAGSSEQEMQAHLVELRNRETQLQIVLILEILALESTLQAGDTGTPTVIELKQEPDDDGPNAILARTPLKATKKRDLRPDLDILVDRLCIYQSVAIIDPAVADEAKNKNGESGKDVRDKLRDFCCNVVLPFYLHKAPAVVREISRKLGGPDLSPKRPISSSRTTSSSRTKPGTAIDTRRRSIPRRTLERVLSEEQSSRQSTPPVLMRSATAPLGGGGGRDSAEPIQRPGSRGSLQKSHSFTNREVDLVASSIAHNAKQKKLASLAKQKKDLDAAICALKKPNRSLVGMEIMADVEKRSAAPDTSRRNFLSRKSSAPNLGVQIMATPKKGTIVGNATRKAMNPNHDWSRKSENWPKSVPEEPAIPSSTVRNVDDGTGQSIGKTTDPHKGRQADHPGVNETPSRVSHRTSNPLKLPSSIQTLHPPCSPARLYHSSDPSLVQATPSANRLRPDCANLAQVENTPLRMTKSQRPVVFTPLGKAEVRAEGMFRDAPIVPERAGKAMERAMDAGGGKEASIYDSLGWDDDVDELM
jgi:DNA replication regulator SLD3